MRNETKNYENFGGKNRFKKSTSLFLIITIFLVSFSPVFSRKAEAQLFVPVWDPGNFSVNTVTSANTTMLNSKENGLDGIAFTIINMMIEKIAASTVNWINSGFKGSPAYVTNPEAYFKDIGDRMAGQFIFNNPNLNFLCGPISAKIKLALATNYTQSNIQWQCTLTQAGKNFDNFMTSFENGGWDSFFEVSQKTQMNPIGAYLQAENAMNQQITSRLNTKLNELNWGRGFLSFETCGEEGRDEDGVCIGKASIETPGSVIENQLNSVLGTGENRIAAADEINEILSALINEIAGRIVGGLGGTLRSMSQSQSGSQKFTDQLSNSTKDTKIKDYFKVSETAVDKVINMPPYDPYLCRDNPSLPECQLPIDPTCDPNSASYNPSDPICNSDSNTGL